MAAEARIPEAEQQQDTAILMHQLQALQNAFDCSDRKAFERALHASERRYRELFDNVLTGVYRVTPAGDVLLANPALARMLVYTHDAKIVIRRIDPGPFTTCLEREGEVRGLESTWVRKDGGHIIVRETAKAVKGISGDAIFYEGIVEDITGEKRAELFDRECRHVLEMVARNEPLEAILSRISALLEGQAPGLTCSISLRTGGRLYPLRGSKFPAIYSRAGVPIRAGYGSSAHAVHSRRTVVFPDVMTSDEFSRFRELAQLFFIGSAWSTPICSDGEVQGTIAVFRKTAHEPDAQEIHMAETASRLAAVAIEHRRLYENLHRQATKDCLTGLPNRSVFERTLAECLQPNAEVALLWIDLDRFKEVNDSLGHRVGDVLIQQVAERLSQCAGRPTLLARTGGDEFAIILSSLESRKHAEACAMRVLAALQGSLQVDEYELFVTASVGISMFPSDAATACELHQKADAAMYRAKSRGKNCYAFYDANLERGAKERLETETGLRRALQNRELALFYQPQVDLEGNLKGLEALVRWQHPKRGLVAPTDFIPIAEETGLIVPIGSWVIREACKQCAEWHRAGYKNLKIAVNVSALQFYFSDLLEIVRNALHSSDLPPACLELELTESLIMKNSEDSTKELQRLRSLGVSVAIDDFGTGYSSLSYLQKLPVDLLKIDRSFLQDVDAASTCALIQAITAVAHSLGLRVAAEGVETEVQLDSIRRIGVDLAQGYLFGKPMPTDLVTRYLETAYSS
jgi:diguanylate cyclase (GGDEF)-like protein